MRSGFYRKVFLLLLICLLAVACSPANTRNNSQTDTAGDNSKIPPLPEKQGSYAYEVSTSRGIVWNTAPAMEGQDLDIHPVSPFILYLSSDTAAKLDQDQAQKLLELPLQMDTPLGKLNVFLVGLYSTSDWVVYPIYLASPGMNQPYVWKLYALNLTDKKNMFITDFHCTGGMHFTLGLKDGKLLLHQQSLDSKANETYAISLFDLNTGKKSEVPLNKIQEQNDKFSYQGEEYTLIRF